jgi:Fe2+ or Zn2+ uptake regulation protein
MRDIATPICKQNLPPKNAGNADSAALFRLLRQKLATSHKPLGAYEIIHRIARKKARPAPITVYRALEFLMQHGFVHRIESRNAYLACGHNHGSGALVAFLMCDTCGTVGEASTAAMSQVLAAATKKADFRPTRSVNRNHWNLLSLSSRLTGAAHFPRRFASLKSASARSISPLALYALPRAV